MYQKKTYNASHNKHAILDTRFEFRDFAKVFGSGILIYAFLIGIFSVFPGIPGTVEDLHPAISFTINYSLQLLILFSPLYYFVLRKYAASPGDFGLQGVKISKLLFTVICTYIFYIALTIIISTYLYVEQVDLPGYHPQDSHLPLFGTDMAGMITAIIFIVIIAPIFEEIFFRGFVYRVLKKTWSLWFGSIVSAALFALFHFEFQSFIPIFILGILLNYNYERTGSLWTSIAFHMLNNGVAFGMELYMFTHPEFLNDLVSPLGLI